MVILIYNSQTDIYNAEDILIDNDIYVELIATPKEVNYDCGTSLSLSYINLDCALTVLQENYLIPIEIYKKVGRKYILL